MQGNFTEFYVAHKLELRKGLGADGGLSATQIRRVAALQMSQAVYTQRRSVSLLGDIGAGNCYSKTGLVSLKKCLGGGRGWRKGQFKSFIKP